jgi:gliding motility-associated-like protein
LGDTTLEWWAIDEAGNRDYALQAISVRDREKPQGTCPTDIVIDINENEYSAIVNYTIEYTDNCGVVTDSLNTGLRSGEKFPLGETKVRYFLSDKAGNTETCEFNVVVRHPPRQMEVSLRPSAYQICPGQEVILTSAVSGGSGKYDYSWRPRPWAEAVMKDYPLTNTVYEVTVNDGITSETKSVTVTVLETQPVTLALEGRRMDEIFEGDEVLVTATPGFSSYKLLLNHEVVQETGLNYSVSFEAELGAYFIGVFATDANYCVSQDQLQIDIESRKLPNVFTPNNDGKNDIFLEEMAEKSKELNKYFELQVFSRTGELLYKGFDGWDGKYKGKVMPQGTYLWVVKRIMNNGELRTLKGNVTLKL